ncbi:hypothetical protein VBD025_14595 [Virgibacillus flavescens]|uniref:hypothetical protein n=1 Tax=Virgibacillus flavescens TaxID=1611422 RepID=UPI003D33506F
METNKLHYLIALLSYPIVILLLFFGNYTSEKLLSGIIFYSVSAVIYVGFTYLFFKSEKGKNLVLIGLLCIMISAIFMAFRTA